LRTEAAVVGAGPAGLIAARELAGRGFEVKVFEEHPVIGEPNHCAGILSVEGLKRLGVPPHEDFIQHEIKGGTIFSPSGASIRITSARTRAYTVDRALFDRFLAEMAMDRGAEIEIGHRMKELSTRDSTVTGVRGDADVRSEIVLDAEGASGALARRIGLPRPEDGILAGVNVDIPNLEMEQEMVEVWLGEDLAPGLFVWAVPAGEVGVRCGLATRKGDAFELVKVFIERRFGVKDYAAPVRWPVLTGGPIKKTYTDGLLLVGDVAGQVKPTTGGGVVLGGMCAMMAAEVAAEAIEAGDTSASFLRRYEERWRRGLGREFSTMLGARRFINKISDDNIDRVFDSLKSSGLEPILERFVEEGDMDVQSGVLRKALTHPSMLRVLVASVGRLAVRELMGLFNL
jgi:digeranylgeranylglycerophospholipid reductase